MGPEDDYRIPEGKITTPLRWWNGLPSVCTDRLQEVLSSWVGTPYGEGQRARRIAVDCVQLCGGVLDDLFRVAVPSVIPRLQADAAMHDIKRGWPTVRAVRSLGLGSDIANDGTIRPGDVIITRAEDHPSAPHRAGHVMIAGVQKWSAIHAVPHAGVCWTSIHPDRVPIIQIMRHRGKESWR